MNDKTLKHYLFASDFDQTLTFNDSGYVLSEIVGIPTEEFERKAAGMAKINLVQQGAELAYLLLHDPEFRSRVRKEHLYEVGKRIRLKDNIGLLDEILDHGIEGFHFDFSIVSAAPVEVITSALEGIIPPERIYGTEFKYKSSGEIDTIVRARAGFGKVAADILRLNDYAEGASSLTIFMVRISGQKLPDGNAVVSLAFKDSTLNLEIPR